MPRIEVRRYPGSSWQCHIHYTIGPHQDLTRRYWQVPVAKEDHYNIGPQQGHWQVPVAKEDRHKIAFTSPFDLYQFCVMPFGLNRAPATLQRLMNEVV